MALREFTDSKGITWRVWSTVPTAGMAAGIVPNQGWLTFDCGSARRRLIPIPRGWEDVSVDRLELMCRAAIAVNARSILPESGDRASDSG